MSSKNNSKKSKKINWTRLLALVLAFLMFASVGTLGILMLINGVSAVDISYDESNYTFSSETDGNLYIAVGLMYGTGVTVSFEIKAPYGFVVGDTTISRNVRAFKPLYYLESDIAAVTVDANLKKKSMAYYLTDNPNETVVGGYHLEFTNIAFEGLPLTTLLDEVTALLDGYPIYAIPAIIRGENKIRAGSYPTKEAAEAALAEYSGNFSNYALSVVGPSNSCSTVINPNTDQILFEFDPGEEATDHAVGFTAYQNDQYDTYIQTPANNLYEGVMTFIPQHTDTYTGIALTNLLDLESYVEGVLPYEISNSWGIEALRTFAITIRSYAYASYGKWYDKYGFDMTCTTSDQVYRGRNRVNDAVVEAVQSTTGLITSYDGKVASAYYSSSVGGSTVSSQYVWGSERGYLKNISTPWEHYSEYNNGIWRSEVSPKELCDKLRSKGYTELKGSIASISGTTTNDGSGYVYSMTFTDTSGTSVTIKRSDNVRTVLSSYLNSANFVFGQGSLDFTYNKVQDVTVIGGIDINDPNAPTPEKPAGKYDFNVNGYITNNQALISDVHVITADNETSMPSQYPVAYVLTSTGRKVIMNSCVAVEDAIDDTTPFSYKNGVVNSLDPSSDITNDTGDSSDEDYTGIHTEPVNTPAVETSTPIGDNSYIVTSEFGHITIKTKLETITETITASSSQNFIFAGKGWGHGVGISQYGVKDLSDAGAKAEDILAIYFTGISIVSIDSLR